MAGEKLPNIPSQPGLEVEHCSVSVAGQDVGLAASLGSGFVFYTTNEKLQEFDGIRFGSMEELRATVLAAVGETPEPGMAA